MEEPADATYCDDDDDSFNYSSPYLMVKILPDEIVCYSSVPIYLEAHLCSLPTSVGHCPHPASAVPSTPTTPTCWRVLMVIVAASFCDDDVVW